MIKRVNLFGLTGSRRQAAASNKGIVEDAIREICEWRDAMRKINATALDALSEPAELQHFPGGGFAPKLIGEGSEMPKRYRA